MKNLIDSIRLSARSFGSVATLAVCGMLVALEVILGFFTVPVSPLLKVGFAFLPVAVCGMLYGPLAAGSVGALCDIVSYLIQPIGPYFPGFTLNGFISGFVYGAILYRRPVTLPRSLAVKAVITVLISFLLTPLWLSVLYGKAFLAVVSARLVTNLIELPVDVALLYAVLKVTEKSHNLFPQKKY